MRIFIFLNAEIVELKTIYSDIFDPVSFQYRRE